MSRSIYVYTSYSDVAKLQKQLQTKVIIVVIPSGHGKHTLAHRLLHELANSPLFCKVSSMWPMLASACFPPYSLLFIAENDPYSLF